MEVGIDMPYWIKHIIGVWYLKLENCGTYRDWHVQRGGKRGAITVAQQTTHVNKLRHGARLIRDYILSFR